MTELFDPATLAEAADEPGRYVERYRFSPLLVAGLSLMSAIGVVSMVLTVAVIVAFHAEPAPATADVVLFGTATAVLVLIAVATAVFVTRWIHAAATHQVAFRADRHGITLGAQPYPPTRTVTVPWSDLARIEVGWTYTPVTRSVVLTLRRDAPRRSSIVRRIRVWWTYNASGDVGRHLQGWRLDGVRLRTTVATYAPHVVLVNP